MEWNVCWACRAYAKLIAPNVSHRVETGPGCLAKRQPEIRRVAICERMRWREGGRARFCVLSRSEVSNRLHTPARELASFKDGYVVTRVLKLVTGRQSGKPTAESDNVLRLTPELDRAATFRFCHARRQRERR